MQIKQTSAKDQSRTFEIKMSPEEIAEKIEERLLEIGKTVKLPGFRPGKVPMQVLKSRYGQAVMGEVLEKAVNDSTLQAINENKLKPAMQPKIEVKTFEEGKGLEYTMEVELLPEITLMDVSKIKLEKPVAQPSDEAVNDALDRIAQSNRQTEKLNETRAAKSGDVVLIDFDGTVDGEAFPGMKGDNHELELGSGAFIPGFEDQLIGAKPGEDVTVTVTFPDPYSNAQLSGKEAKFEVKVKELRKTIPAELNDDFAKKLGLEDVAALKRAVCEQMQAEYDQVSRTNVKKALLDALDEGHSFDAPQAMVDSEFDMIWQQVTYEHEHHQHPPGEACTHEAPDEQEYKDIALRRVRLGLILSEIGQANEIQVTPQELQQGVINEARRYPGQEQKVFEHYQKNPQALDAIRAPIFEEKVVDYILELADVTEKTVSAEALLDDQDEATPKKKKPTAKKQTSSKKGPSKKATAKKTSASKK